MAKMVKHAEDSSSKTDEKGADDEDDEPFRMVLPPVKEKSSIFWNGLLGQLGMMKVDGRINK